MAELEDIWAEQPQETIEEHTVDNYLQSKSTSELRLFERIIRIELGVGSVLLISSIWWLAGMPDVLKGMMMFILWFSTMLAGLTLWRIKKITFQSDVKAYLDRSLRFFQAYLASFSLSAATILVATAILVKQAREPQASWGEWLMGTQGQNLLLVTGLIASIMTVYALLLYVPRITRLKHLLRELEEEVV
ncbi:MAG TPA: hypothetical protein DCE41_09495 [Cytophagales bacterium]|nr:hypothetical protein [Cytophagales bacterium]HAP61575.1 hypothetical protein [Cytophagales bacterium]